MSNITDMERQLSVLDASDEAGGEATNWRLKNRYHEEGLDTTKKDLLENLEKEIVAYGMLLHRPFGLQTVLTLAVGCVN
jgi:hypothetical protein